MILASVASMTTLYLNGCCMFLYTVPFHAWERSLASACVGATSCDWWFEVVLAEKGRVNAPEAFHSSVCLL